MPSKKFTYRERDNYIPKEIRKQHGIGEYAKTETTKKTTKKKATKK